MITTYKSVRSKIKEGDILLCSGKSDVSKIIKKISKIGYEDRNVQYTHIGIFDWWHGRLMVSEACEGKGVQHNNFSNKYIQEPYEGRLFIARVNSESPEIKDVMAKLADAMSCDYSESDLVKIALNKLSGTKFKSDPNDNSFICSELVNHAFGYIFKNKNKFCIPNDIAYSGKLSIIYEII